MNGEQALTSSKRLDVMDRFALKAIGLGILLTFVLECYYIVTNPGTAMFFVFIDIFLSIVVMFVIAFYFIIQVNKMKLGLNESEEIFRNVIASSPNSIMVVDFKGKIVECNEAASLMHKCSSSVQMIGRDIFEFVALKDQTKVKENLEKITRQGLIKDIEYTMLTEEGVEFPVELSMGVIKDTKGKPSSIVHIIKDVTEQKHNEKLLRESEKRYRELVDLLPQTVFEIDIGGKVTFVNRCAFETFGYSQNDVDAGLNVVQLFTPDERGRVKKNIRKVLKGENLGGNEHEMVKKNGETLQVCIYSSPIMNENKLLGFRGIIVDISERKLTEEKLFRTVRNLERFNRLAVGRELQMIELKKEVNGLLRTMGRPEVYRIPLLDETAQK